MEVISKREVKKKIPQLNLSEVSVMQGENVTVPSSSLSSFAGYRSPEEPSLWEIKSQAASYQVVAGPWGRVEAWRRKRHGGGSPVSDSCAGRWCRGGPPVDINST